MDMLYRELGSSRIEVSKFAVGTWQFGQSEDWGQADVQELQRVVDYAVDAGVNLFDTAEAYGKSEEILGNALKGRRNEIILCTKIWGIKWDYNTIQRKIEGSLKRLQTDYIDLYLIHWPKRKGRWGCPGDMEKKDYENISASMCKLREEGLIRFAGVSNFRSYHLKEFDPETFNFIVTDQVPYSLLWRCYDVDGTSDFCRQKKMSFLAYSPLGQGLLTGRFGKDSEESATGRRQANVLFNRPLHDQALKVVDVVKEVAEETDATPTQVALKWAMEREIVASVLVGMRKLEHIEENVKSVNLQLTTEQLTRLDQASLEFQNTILPELELWIDACRKSDLDKLNIRS